VFDGTAAGTVAVTFITAVIAIPQPWGIIPGRVRGRCASGRRPRYLAEVPSCLVDRVNPALLAYALYLPPSAVLLVSDYRFRRFAQRLARLTL
jgi:hypothetical protein